MGARKGPSLPTILSAYLCYIVLFVFGYVRDWVESLIYHPRQKLEKGYAPLLLDFDDFFTRRMYYRVRDCWNRPIASCPGAYMDVLDRTSQNYNETFEYSGQTSKCLNLGSYNYLGFGDPNSPTKESVLKAIEQYGAATASTRLSMGTTVPIRDLERLVARFVGKPEAVVYGMGFGTNSTGIPALVGPGGLIISDATNHASAVTGARTSGAKIKVFKHNDTRDLERAIREAIVEGQPRSHRPWKKIVIMIEGIYSMEGAIAPLEEIVRLKKKYNCYLFVDEAHSIGALGKTGRGICEYAQVDPADVDILMGTFTKAFGAVGGYIASSKDVIATIRDQSAGSVYSGSISPPAAQQCVSALKVIMGEDGTDIGRQKLQQLNINANMFRRRLLEMGVSVLGNYDSPIIPIMLYHPTRVAAFSRFCLKNKLAVVVVGFPATPLLLARARVCISAAHTKEDLEKALAVLKEALEYKVPKEFGWLW